MEKKLVDISPVDRFIIAVPEDVYDVGSYVQGVEDTLAFVRSLPEEQPRLQSNDDA